MFQHVTIFSKRHNILSYPNPQWKPKNRIYCTAELQLGFGAVIRWTQHNPIKLTAMISFYKKLSRPRYGTDETLYSFQIDKSTIIRWRDTPDWKTIIQVFGVEHRYWDGTFTPKEELVIEKTISTGLACRYGDDFFNAVIRMLILGDAEEMVRYFAELINRDKPRSKAEYKVGQRVTTIVGPNVKTARTGYIISIGYHENDKTYLYFLMVDGEIRTKRYLPGDLRLAPISAT